MRRVRSADTTPEKRVRALLQKLGFRFRLHRSDLPGKPDIVLPKHNTVIFVHGCFWHRHPGCNRATTPATHQEYWLPKFARTIKSDGETVKELRRQGWNVAIVWECETKDASRLTAELIGIIGHNEPLPQSASIAMVAEGQKAYNIGRYSTKTGLHKITRL